MSPDDRKAAAIVLRAMTRALRWMLYRREVLVMGDPLFPELDVLGPEQPRTATRLFLYLKGRLER